MIQTVVAFVVIFATVFSVLMVVSHMRAVALEARQELIALRARQQQLAQTMSNDMWRANKRMRMH